MPFGRSARAVVLVLALTAVVACTVPEEAGRSSTTTAEITGPPAPTPEVGQCRGLISFDIIRAAYDVRPPISCLDPHGSETVSVSDLPLEIAGLSHRDATSVPHDSPEMRPVLDQCAADFETYVGTGRVGADAVRESNLSQAFFIPGFEDWARGARWIRCDVVTPPLNGEPTRGVTDRLSGILDRRPLPPEMGACFRSATPPPRLTFEFPVSCDQPHAVEAVLRFPVEGPALDAVVGDPVKLEEFTRSELGRPCVERIAGLVGLPADSLAARADLVVASVPLGLSMWAADPEARWAQCLVSSPRATIGSVEGLGDRPLALP